MLFVETYVTLILWGSWSHNPYAFGLSWNGAHVYSDTCFKLNVNIIFNGEYETYRMDIQERLYCIHNRCHIEDISWVLLNRCLFHTRGLLTIHNNTRSSSFLVQKCGPSIQAPISLSYSVYRDSNTCNASRNPPFFHSYLTPLKSRHCPQLCTVHHSGKKCSSKLP